ncbi:zinc finger CCCH domain-containing protein 7A [Stigmatopora nigra]
MSRMKVLDGNSRWEKIQEDLQFLASPLPFPSPNEYEVFIKDLVLNLFEEGNDLFKEGNWNKSVEMYTESLNITDYASEEVCIASNLIEMIHANRAAAYLSIIPGLYDQALEDCEKALQLNDGNYKALYRKAKCLNEMGKYQEAYDAGAKCVLVVPQDPSVIQLIKDLAKILGLKIRKSYVRNKVSQNPSSVEEIETEIVPLDDSVSDPTPVVVPPPNDSTVDKPPLCRSIPPKPVSESSGFESDSLPLSTPSSNGCQSEKSPSLSETSQNSEIIGSDLDDLLDETEPEPDMLPSTVKGTLPLTAQMPSTSSMPSPFLIPSCINPILSSAQQSMINLPLLSNQLGSSACFGMDTLKNPAKPLETLDNLCKSDKYKTDYSAHSFAPQINKGLAVGNPKVLANKNPLSETHEFKQACLICYTKTGTGVLDYTLYIDEHKCKKDLLLCRQKSSPDNPWRLIRPRPTKPQNLGPYYICRDVAAGKDCPYPGYCTFPYSQEEMDFWMLERKGFISRELLFDPFGASSKMKLTVAEILQEFPERFVFLCEACFDHKPRIISKTNKANPSICSHPEMKHDFEKQKCLVHVMKDNTVRYSKIRMFNPPKQLNLCRHEGRYRCQMEDECNFAHSPIELQVWMLQQECRISHESIVEEATTYWNSNIAPQRAQCSVQRRFGPPNLKMMFVCSQCWRNGQLSEADKQQKYCSAKARHTWAKDKRVVLVSSIERKKWTPIRALPATKPIPAQFEICRHVAASKKCQYIGNCTFAHGPEERDFWTFMKENNIADFDQLYESWLESQRADWGEENANVSGRENGKPIQMPTDYVEEVDGNHCWFCAKNCNSEKQWQKHITSEKHKDRVFSSEDDDNRWQYRFPTGIFQICERFKKDTCTKNETCKMAHGEKELQEWKERHKVLLRKLDKARKDHLIAPNDNEFGKYRFLLKNT